MKGTGLIMTTFKILYDKNKSYFVDCYGEQFYFPKKLIYGLDPDNLKSGEIIHPMIPVWMAKKKGLISC